MKDEETFTMKDLPESERPYEKCENFGPGALSDAELLAVIIQSGTRGKRALDVAYSLLRADERNPGLSGAVALKPAEMTRVNGIGRIKAIKLSCVFELAKRIARTQAVSGKYFRDPDTVADYYMPFMRTLEHEELRVMFLDTRNALIRECLMTKGTVNRSLADPRDIFIKALEEHAVRLIMVHNHPSGDPSPSESDISLTKRVKSSGELIGIGLVDHIIIGSGAYYSFNKEGCL
ncbi:MAG: DNA repair protein RadC [Lachnospiraceae bacterium]|nr:DNA repair protein RadC [Lachnospiraceae bacterium]